MKDYDTWEKRMDKEAKMAMDERGREMKKTGKISASEEALYKDHLENEWSNDWSINQERDSMNEFGEGTMTHFLKPNDDLLNESDMRLSSKEFELKMCIVGRPNVGKSSLINVILGEKRCLVADLPGITRDSVAIPMYDPKSQRKFKLIDTAGIIGLTRGAYERQNEDWRVNVLVCPSIYLYFNILNKIFMYR